MSNVDDLLYDEDDSLEFIRTQLLTEMNEKLSDDDINYVVDLVYEYYEEKGYLDDNVSGDADIEIDEDELIAYVVKNAEKDEIGPLSEDEIAAIVESELAYCDSIDLFE